MGRFSVTCVLLAPRVTRKQHLVQALGPGVIVVFLTFLVLEQRGGGCLNVSAFHNIRIS